MNAEVDRWVSIVVPCRNERAHVADFVARVRAQVLPSGWSLEIVVADGSSDDGTRDALDAAIAGDPRIVRIDNPERIVSTGLNRAIAVARGEVIVRMDVHTEYAPDYVRACLDALAASAADNVGGPWHAVPGPRPMERAIAAAFQSRWVFGGATSRRLDFDGWVDTVYLGCWPRATFVRFGGFDEQLVRNQDDEHNLRIVKGGGRIWQSSRIVSRYRPRASLWLVFRQYLQYGYWKPFVMKKHGQAASLRQVVPALFVLALVASALMGAGLRVAAPPVVLIVAYAAAVLAMTAATVLSHWPGPAAAVRVPAVIVTTHLAYGLGSCAGAWDAFVARRPRARFATLTR